MSQPQPQPPQPPIRPEQGGGTPTLTSTATGGTGTGTATGTLTGTATGTGTGTGTGTATGTVTPTVIPTGTTLSTSPPPSSTTRPPLPSGADQNTPIRACDQYPLASVDSLRTSWAQSLVRALERNLTNALPLHPDPILLNLVRTALDNPNTDTTSPDLSLARTRADTQIAAALLPYWGSRHVAGCFRFARFHADLVFCTDGSVAARPCPVNDKCPALGQPLVVLGPGRDPEMVPGVELRDIPLNILIPSPTLKINAGNTSILVPPPENAAAAIVYGCWDVPNVPGSGNTDPSARYFVCQTARGDVITPESDPAPWSRGPIPRLLCPVPFRADAPAVSPVTPILQPGAGSNQNGMADGSNSGTMLTVPAIVGIVVGSSILAAALVALGLFARSRLRSRRHSPSSSHARGGDRREGHRSLFAPPTLSTISVASHHLAPGAHRRGSDDATPRSSFMLMHASTMAATTNAAPGAASAPLAMVADADRIVTTVRWENTVVAGHDARQLLASCTPAPPLPTTHADDMPLTPTSPTAASTLLPYDVAAIRAEWDALFSDVSRLINERIAALDEQHLAKLAVYQTVASQSLGYSAASVDRRTSFTATAGERRSLSAASFSNTPQSPALSTLSLQRAVTSSPPMRSISASTASLAGSTSSPPPGSPLSGGASLSTNAHLSALLFQLANVIFAHFLPAHLLSADKRTTYGNVVAAYHPAYAHVRAAQAQQQHHHQAPRPTVGPKAAFRGMADLTTPGANLALDPVRRAAALRAALGAMVSTTVRDMRRVLSVAGLATAPAPTGGRPQSTPAGGAFLAQAHVADDMALRALVDRLVSLVFRIKAAIPSAAVYFPPLQSQATGVGASVVSPKMGPSDTRAPHLGPRDGAALLPIPDHCLLVTRANEAQAKGPVQARSPTADSARAESPAPLLGTVDEQRASPTLVATSANDNNADHNDEPKVQFAYWPGVVDDDRKVVVVPARVWVD